MPITKLFMKYVTTCLTHEMSKRKEKKGHSMWWSHNNVVLRQKRLFIFESSSYKDKEQREIKYKQYYRRCYLRICNETWSAFLLDHGFGGNEAYDFYRVAHYHHSNEYKL